MANFVQQTAGGAIGFGTLAVNVTGAFALGFLARYFTPPYASHTAFLALTVGLCGGYTTFSAFSLDLFTLFERGQLLKASVYAIVSVVLSFIALAAGYFAARGFRPLP